MQEITSVNNENVKNCAKLQQKKYREETKEFLLEGYKSIKEAFDAGIEIKQVFVAKEKISIYKFLEEKIIATTEPVLKKLSTTETAPEAVAVGIQKKYDKNILKSVKNVALLENIKDLGNLGTILRSAAAFSIDAVILLGNTVDLYNPKCVRASVGNLWKVPVLQFYKLDEIKPFFKDFKRIATLPKNDNSVFLKDFAKGEKNLILLGSEADGLTKELIDYSTDKVTIEMKNTVESLNLSVSASIIFYELFT